MNDEFFFSQAPEQGWEKKKQASKQINNPPTNHE
jgi:galactokinase/mevalonate kinase-like predicted kinase